MDLKTTAILAIDLQNEYRPGAPWAVDGYDELLANVAALMQAGRAAGMKVIHAQAWVEREESRNYVLQDGTVSDEFRSAIAGSVGAEICAEVAPEAGDIVFFKKWPSAFYRSEFKDLLASHGIRTLIVTGVLTESCVMGTVFDAVYEGFHVWLVKDGCGSMTPHMHRTGMLSMANRLYGGAVLRQAAVLDAISGRPSTAWRCTRPIEFAFTAENVDALYDAL